MKNPAVGLAASMLISAALALAAASAVDWALLTLGGIVARPEFTSSMCCVARSCW